MIVQQAIANAVQSLKQAEVADPVRDARLLMAACLGIPVGRLTLHTQEGLSDAAKTAFFEQIEQREQRVPVSHLLGAREFYGRTFKVTPDVLDPRGDTETLIEAALQVPFDTVLDLGTGSGCILITLLAERAKATGIGVDLSERAVAVATQNAALLAVEGRSDFVVGDWYERVAGQFDLIVSNPPYIAADEMSGLSAELSHEPRMALSDEADGLSCYRVIAKAAGRHLNAGGWLIVEIGPTQGAAVSAMFKDAGLTQVEIRPDLDRRERVVLGKKPL